LNNGYRKLLKIADLEGFETEIDVKEKASQIERLFV